MDNNKACEMVGHRYRPRRQTKRHQLSVYAKNDWNMIILASLILIVTFPVALLAYYFIGKDTTYLGDICTKCGRIKSLNEFK